jgi:hypothetical protein
VLGVRGALSLVRTIK